jgi:ribosomal protein L40E
MNICDDKAISSLQQISRELAVVVESLTQSYSPPVFPEEAAGRVKKHVCLICSADVPKGARYVRGLCNKCRKEADNLMGSGQVTEKTLIERGLLAPVSRGGRKSQHAGRLLALLANNPIALTYEDELKQRSSPDTQID